MNDRKSTNFNTCARIDKKRCDDGDTQRPRSQPSVLNVALTCICAQVMRLMTMSVLDRRFGIRESAMDWFSSYLSDQTQSICANSVMSRPISVTCSVPQGSVLGPMLFISYTDDVTLIFDSHQVNHHLYADDKQAYVSVPVNNVSLARQILERCVSDITSWCASRRLQLNAAKTELIWFGSRQMWEKY